MKVQLLVSRADSVRAYSVGDEIDVSDAEAGRMIEAGHAVAVIEQEPKREKAAKKRVAEKRG